MTTLQSTLSTHRELTRRLHEELAQEARAYLTLLERQQQGEDVEGELYASTAHLGTHATLLANRMEEASELADALEENQEDRDTS